jgi:peptide/nickel transport system substrate-binding protein
MDAMLEAVRTERDDAKRRQIVWEMQALVHRDCSVIIPVFADFLDAKSTKLQGFEPSTYREMDGYRIAERAWLG